MPFTMSDDPVVRSAGRWFWWIAGLSLVNTVLFFTGSEINFVLGLGLTQIVNGVFGYSLAIAAALNAVAIGFYFALGVFAQREKAWAFWLGLVVYALDALFYVKFQDWLPVAFHAFAGFYLFRGAMHLRQRGQPATA